MKIQTQRQATYNTKYLVFILNPKTHYYEMTQGENGFSKVPNELKLEETQKKGLIKSDFLIRGGNGKGKSFFTGIIKTKFRDWFFADYFEIRNGIKRNSFILLHFSTEKTTFEVYFFNHFKLYPKRRGYFIRDFITSLKQ